MIISRSYLSLLFQLQIPLGLRLVPAASATLAPSSNSSFNPLRAFNNPFGAFRSNASKPTSDMSTTPTPNITARTDLTAPVICVSHGGGPMPILGDPSQANIAKSLRTRVPEILKLGTKDQPRAIVLVTAHWSTKVPTVSSAERHGLYYDYYGFPDEAYRLKYDAPGSREVAVLVGEALKGEGLDVDMDEERGWDHGVFIPMMLINPSASIPIVQLSVLSSESPTSHFSLGRALSTLRSQNIAIIGSGFASLHNLGAMFSGKSRTPAFKSLNEAWSRTVTDAVQTEDMKEREDKFKGWRKWPGAYDMHPRGGAEHFLPLIVCAGAAGVGKAKAYKDECFGLDMWSYYWE